MKPIVKVENLSKSYRIGSSERGYATLRDALATAVKSPLKRLRKSFASNSDTIWALRDVSFDVAPGEILGLVGRNGAGKSTALKILSRITEPTSGRVELYGRLGSLLEVGTGFHAELTGRENIYLSGAILGMPRAEINRKLDAVVAFSGVERFIDTPVKRYSSGMYVRLAFSVAAHMEPEILLVDEVLAVGDLAFQQKCLERMKKLKTDGTTIILVSHNTAIIESVCQRAIYLAEGKVAAWGPPTNVVKQYRDDQRRRKGKTERASEELEIESSVTITGFEICGSDGAARHDFRFGEEVRIRISLRADSRVELPVITCGIVRADGVIVCNFNNWYDNFDIDYIEGDCTLEGWLPPLRLTPNHYDIHVLVWPTRRRGRPGDLERLRPLALASFNGFTVEGPPLTEGDGVFQQPAHKWVLTRGEDRVVHEDIASDAIFEAYSCKSPFDAGQREKGEAG